MISLLYEKGSGRIHAAPGHKCHRTRAVHAIDVTRRWQSRFMPRNRCFWARHKGRWLRRTLKITTIQGCSAADREDWHSAALGLRHITRAILHSEACTSLDRGWERLQRVATLWLNKYALGHWGDRLITDLHPRPVELWLDCLPLAPKTRGHLRELLHRLVDYAMWSGTIPVGTNPISLVTVRACSKRRKQPHSLTLDDFQHLSTDLGEPFRSMALVRSGMAC